jgi:hypothetical protein
MSEQAYSQFRDDVASHQMTVLRDDGLYRHLRFAHPGTYCMSFDVVTWPGYLTYSGDMGCYVFTRIQDMFEFFRRDDPSKMDRGYWAEKCVGADKPDGVRRYSEDLFREAINSRFDDFVDAAALSDDERDDLWRAIEDDVLPNGDNIHDAIRAASNFYWLDAQHVRHEVFTNFWDCRLEDYTPRFVWCCYALPWAVARYDAAKQQHALTEKVD